MLNQAKSQSEYKVSSARWFALVSLGGLGILLGFIIAFPGTVNLIFTKYYNLDVRIVDWFTLCKAVSQILFTVPIGLYAIANPLKVRFWLLIASLLFGICFALISVAVIVKTLFWMIFIGMLFAGVADTIFRACVPLVALTWFSDDAQGTICGIAYGCLATGSAIAVITSVIFLNLTSPEEELLIAVNAIIWVSLSCCLIGLLLVLITWKFVLESPPSPPSWSTAQRWIEHSTSSETFAFKNSAKKILQQLKVLMTDKSSIALVLSFGIVLSALALHFMMLPPLQDEQQASSTLSVTKQKSYLLIGVALFNIVGSTSFGAVMDRMKSYKKTVLVIGVPSTFCSVAMLLGYFLQSQIALYVSTASYSFFFFSLLPIVVGSLKQHSEVNEVVQTVFCVIVWNVIMIIFSETYRFTISRYGAISFYICNVIVCFMTISLLVSIKPCEKRCSVEN